MAARESSGLLRQRCGRPSELVGAGCGVWGRAARAAALRSADDDQGVGVWVLRGGVQLAADRATLGRGCGVSGAGGGQRAELPYHRGFSQARSGHARRVVEEVLKIALAAGALKLGRVALAGTTLKANASKHKALSYGRMKERERQLRAEIRELLAQAEAVDAAEDAHYGAARRGDELLVELQRRETRLQKIRAAQRALEERVRQSA